MTHNNNISEETAVVSSKVLPGPIELLKQSFAIYRAKFVTLITIVLVPTLFNALVKIIPAAETGGVLIGLIMIGLGLLAAAVAIWSSIALIYALGKNFTAYWAYREAMPKIVPYLIVSAIVGLVTIGGLFLLVVPGIIFAIWFYLASFIVILEGDRGFNALFKSRAYIAGHELGIAGRIVVFALLYFFAIFLINFIVLFLGASGQWLFLLLSLPLSPFAVIYPFVIYQSLRQIRPEIASQPIRGKKAPWIAVMLLGIIGPLIIAGYAIRGGILKSSSSAENVQDQKRLADLRFLDVNLTLSLIYGQELNCQSGTIHRSTDGGTAIDGSGWLPVDFTNIPLSSVRMTELPIDPLNNNAYFYSFACDPATGAYELNAVLADQNNIEIMGDDGGNNDAVYEVGTDLTLID